MVLLKGVNKSYGNFKVISDFNLKIDNGEICGIVGPNGAGKTSLISMIIGLAKKDSGKIEIELKDMDIESLEIKKNIGYVSDDTYKFLKLKGIEYLNFVADIYGIPKAERKERIDSLSKYFDMTSHLKKRVEDYSKGMKGKISIIASLMHRPKIWVLDEPFDGLDPTTCFLLKKYMTDYKNLGNLIIVSSHNLEIMENLCTKLLLMKNGKVIYEGDMKGLKYKYSDKKSLEEIYIEVLDNERINNIS